MPIFVITMLLLIALFLHGCSEQPEHDAVATVINIAPRQSKWHADKVLVTVRTDNGAIGIKSVQIKRLNCSVGDTIHVSVKGIKVIPDDGFCER